jgi:hypothetical protein
VRGWAAPPWCRNGCPKSPCRLRGRHGRGRSPPGPRTR